jgi:hypothetical protein
MVAAERKVGVVIPEQWSGLRPRRLAEALWQGGKIVITLNLCIFEVAKQKCRERHRRNLRRAYEPKPNGNLLVSPSELRKE